MRIADPLTCFELHGYAHILTAFRCNQLTSQQKINFTFESKVAASEHVLTSQHFRYFESMNIINF